MIKIARVYKCKCTLCGKETTTDKAFKTKKGSKNIYWCNEEEFNKHQDKINERNKCLETIVRMIQVPMLSPMMIKEINKIADFYDYVVIEKCFKEHEQNIKWFLDNNELSNEYGKARYIATIIKNNINNTYKKHIQEVKQMERLFEREKESIDVDIINMDIDNERVITKKTNDISDFLFD